MNSADREEFDWLAFLYVAGELAPDEHDDFERRLEHDPLACDAVSRAVNLTQTIRTAEDEMPMMATPARRSRLQRSLRLAACLSACVLVAIVCRWLLPDGERIPPDASEAPSIAAAELAVVWSETRLELAGQQSDALTLLPPTDSADSPVASEGTAAVDVPDWVLSAVAVEADHESRQEEDG